MANEHGPFTKAYVRKLAKQKGYRIASSAQAAKTGLFAEIWVWGWDESKQRILTCRFYASRDHPHGYCELPPVSDTIFCSGGVQINQLGLPL